jgi:CDP-diglyceride synthetase
VAANSGLEPHIASRSTRALGGECSNLSTGKAVEILVGGAAAGAVIGSMLGYTYYVNVNEQRAARCRVTPTACA